MAILQLITSDGPAAPTLNGAAAEAALREIGVECGQWPLLTTPVSSAPQLTYARELLALQRRFGGARIEGKLQYGLQTLSQQALLSVGAGEWIAWPRGLLRTRVALAEPALDVLRLHAQPSHASNVTAPH